MPLAFFQITMPFFPSRLSIISMGIWPRVPMVAIPMERNWWKVRFPIIGIFRIERGERKFFT